MLARGETRDRGGAWGAYLSANSAGVAARLGPHGAFWLWRSGLLLRLLGAGVCRDGGDGLAGARGDVWHGLRGRVLVGGVGGRRGGRRELCEVVWRCDELGGGRGKRRRRRRLLRRYMYSGRR